MIRTAHNYDRSAVSLVTGLDCPDPSRTQQQFADQADINRIVKQYTQTGVVPGSIKAPLSDDFHAIVDYHSALTAIRSAEDSFAQLPPALRARFENDPGQFLDFLGDEANLAEAVELGLAVARPLNAGAQSEPSPTPKGPAEGGEQ